jgi:hypothetical protein
MSSTRPRSLKEILGNGAGLSRLGEEAVQRLNLADYLREGLPVELRLVVAACNLRDDGTLVISTSSPEWASRLRFESDSLLARCRERFPAATRVRVRVDTNQAPVRPQKQT